MQPWKAHWDHQLYKALEYQYMMGLEALNENLPEIRIDLTYRYDLNISLDQVISSKIYSPAIDLFYTK